MSALPKYLELNPLNGSYYYKNPGMLRKANLGRDPEAALRLAKSLNSKYRIQLEQAAVRLEASVDFGSPVFSLAFPVFVDKYIQDYRLKSSTAPRLRQRQRRLCGQIGVLQLPTIDTQILREAIAADSQFEQSKIKTLLLRFFRYAKSTGLYPPHLANPVDDLFVDPIPQKTRQRITKEQFSAIYRVAPDWLRWMMILGVHLALRRVDLVNLRFDDVMDERIVSAIRKTDSDARDIEATSVDFPIHRDVRRVISCARISSFRANRCPFIIHRLPERKTKRAADALQSGRMEHAAQVLPEYASKAFAKARDAAAAERPGLFKPASAAEMPTFHEVRALSSHLYARAGYEVAAVQDLMAHTDPDMTRAYQKGHARRVLRVEMTLPYSLGGGDDEVREESPLYGSVRGATQARRLRETSLRIL